jgi:hypothetical protein
MVSVDFLCEKCRKPTKKKGSLMMSNTKFDVLVCPSCGHEMKRAVQVMK